MAWVILGELNSVFQDITHVYMVLDLEGWGLSQEPRRVEGKLFFLPYRDI